MTCSTSSVTRRSCGGVGAGPGQQRARSAGVDGVTALRMRLRRSERVPAAAARRSQSRRVRSVARAGTDDPQARQQQAPATGHPDRSGPHRASGPEAGARADLRGGLPAMFLWLPSETSGTGRDRRDPPFTSRAYEWVLEGDIEACFDEIDHTALMDRVRRRVGDKRVLALVKAFLQAGSSREDGRSADTTTGTPQGGILSPLLANIALSVLDEHFAEAWQTNRCSTYQRTKRRRRGLANLPARPLRGRLRGVGGRNPGARRRPCGRKWRRSRPDGPAPVGGENEGLSTSTRASTSSGSASSGDETRHHQARGLHLPVEEGPRLHRRPGPRAHPQVITSDAGCPAAPAQPGAAGLVHLLPPRRVQSDLRLPRPVHLASGGPLDPQTTPPDEVGVLLRRYLPGWRPNEDGVVLFQPADGDGQPLPLPGRQHRHTLGEHDRIVA